MARVGRVVVEKDVTIPLRDGVATYADVYRPLAGPPAPVVLVRTPYDKEVQMTIGVLPQWLKLAERGYAVVVQDVRGRWSSAGAFEPFANEGADGVDSVSWAAAQPWSDGRVALLGASYFGATALLAARERPPALRCLVPVITTDDYHANWVYEGGAFQLGFSGVWGAGLAAVQFLRSDCPTPAASRRALLAAIDDPAATLAHTPLTTTPGMSAPGVARWWNDWLAHPSDDAYWQRWSIARAGADVDALPSFHVGGWYDIFLAGTLRNFARMSAAGCAPQKLLIGPWAHTEYDRYLGGRDFGPTGAAAFAGVMADMNRWLDRHLRGDEGRDTGPAVRYFLMGANEWRQDDTWPPKGATTERWYLHSGGRANSLRGDGVLSPEAPGPAEPPDTFLYDPARPVPTGGGNLLMTGVCRPGPWDQRDIEQRDDVLIYTSAPLAAPLTIAGPVRVRLHAATDGPDTDWTAKLVDVYPDGRALNLCDGIIRARYRRSTEQAALLTPGEVSPYTIDLVATANRFPSGHRLRLEISSSNFPRFDRNTNTGGAIAAEAGGRVAVQRVLHTAAAPSWLEVTVAPD